MKFALSPVGLATCVAATLLAGGAHAQAAHTPAAPVLRAAPAKTKLQTKEPEDWIVYSDATYTPVADAVSRHLSAARKAFDAKDTTKAAAEMRAVADELRREAIRAGQENAALVKTDKAVLAADATHWRNTENRLNATAQTISTSAAAIDSGRIKTNADLDKAIDRAARADLDRRWLVTDVATWYPMTDEPQRHFTNAVAAYARKDYKAAAVDIRKAAGYLRLEAARAMGEPQQALNRSIAQLDTLAVSVETGGVKSERSLSTVFANANHALALEYRAKAVESLTRRDYDDAGYELKAAAHGLESAGSWADAEGKAAASTAARDTRKLGDTLASGGKWSVDELAKGLESLGDSLNALGQKIGGTTKAPYIPRSETWCCPEP